MKKFLSLLLVLSLLMGLSIAVSAEESTATYTVIIETASPEITTEQVITTEPLEESPESENSGTAILPAIEQIVAFFFDGNITVSQIVEYGAIVAAAIFSFFYNKYKRKLIAKDKAISKTDIEIEKLQKSNEDLSNQVGLLGNLIVCAYLSNNLVDPELKKKLAAYADELMHGTTLDVEKITARIISTSQTAEYQETIAAVKQSIEQSKQEADQDIQNNTQDIDALKQIITSGLPDASEAIDKLDIGD